MGQKSNPNILRLSLNHNKWFNKYLEKTKEESSFYVFKSFQIQKYINRFFLLHGLRVHTCIIRYTNNSLNLRIAFYCSTFFLKLIQKSNDKNLYKVISSNKTRQGELRKTFFKVLIPTTKRRIKPVKKFKDVKSQINFETNHVLTQNLFSKKLLGCLSKYTKDSLNINLILQNLNKGLSLRLLNKDSQLFRKLILRLRKFSNNEFFKETVNVVLIAIKKKKSAKFLAEFLADGISQLKRHNYYINFLKEVLTVFVNSDLSSINGIKIMIKGRFNGAPRAKKRIFLLGSVSTQTFMSSIDYYETTSYTQNGTFGVRVWIDEK